MSSMDGRLWITFNGEIFNYIELREELLGKGHRFATRSDTEVILNAYREYGEDCVHHFNGQWRSQSGTWKRESCFYPGIDSGFGLLAIRALAVVAGDQSYCYHRPF